MSGSGVVLGPNAAFSCACTSSLLPSVFVQRAAQVGSGFTLESIVTLCEGGLCT